METEEKPHRINGRASPLFLIQLYPVTSQNTKSERRHSCANAHVALQRQAAKSRTYSSDPRLWWQQLLIKEAQLREQEALMVGVINLKWSTAYWQQIHDASEKLARDMAACIELLKQQGERG